MNESLKKAILEELSGNSHLQNRIEKLIDTAEEAESKERERIQRKKEQEATKAIKSLADIAKEKRIIKR